MIGIRRTPFVLMKNRHKKHEDARWNTMRDELTELESFAQARAPFTNGNDRVANMKFARHYYETAYISAAMLRKQRQELVRFERFRFARAHVIDIDRRLIEQEMDVIVMGKHAQGFGVILADEEIEGPATTV